MGLDLVKYMHDIFGDAKQILMPFEKVANPEDERSAKLLKPQVPKVNVTINRIEVASPDPDRFVFGMIRSFEQIVQAPVAPAGAIRGGL